MIREIAVSETRVIYGAKILRMDFIIKLQITKLKQLARLKKKDLQKNLRNIRSRIIFEERQPLK